MRRSVIAIALWCGLPGYAADPAPPALEAVQVTERIGELVPEDASFQDSTSTPVQLKRLLHRGQPLLLSLNYYRCPMLCSLVLSGMVNGLKGTGLKLGRDYFAFTLSIDPRETSDLAAEKKRGYLQALGEPSAEAAWAFTTGEASQIRALADAIGFGYGYDESTKQYAHPAVIAVLTADGRISRYLYGIEFAPRDLKLALVEASGGKVGTSFDRFLLSCFKYDPSLRRYGIYVTGILKGGALLVFASLSALLVALWRRELKRGTV
jgi:protein SCO1/2